MTSRNIILSPVYNIDYSTTLRISGAEIQEALERLVDENTDEYFVELFPESFVMTVSRMEGRRQLRTHVPYEVFAEAWVALLELEMLPAQGLHELQPAELRVIVNAAARRVDLGVRRASA